MMEQHDGVIVLHMYEMHTRIEFEDFSENWNFAKALWVSVDLSAFHAFWRFL